MSRPEIPEIVLMCPCCGQAVYGPPGRTAWCCGGCGQDWTMEVDLSRIERHSVM